MGERSRRPWALVLVLGGFVVEGYFGGRLWLAVGPDRGLLPLIAAGLGGLLVGAGFGILSDGNRWLYFWMYAGLAVLLPLYGALGAAVIFVYLGWGRGSALALTYTEYVDTDSDAEDRVALSGGSVDQMIHHELSVQSYMDIMRGPDRLLKKSLITKILSEWTPNSVALLQQALKDSEYEIRSYASTALTAIENRMSVNILRLQTSYEGDPEAEGNRINLARAYLDYATSGLLEEESSRHYANLAGGILRVSSEAGSAQGESERLELLTLRGQVARLAGETDAERDIYEEILRRQPEHQDTLRNLCTLDFREKRFGELRQHCQRFVRHTAPDHPAIPAARLWADDESRSR